MARWSNIPKYCFDKLHRTGNALTLLENATAEIILDNNTFYRPEHKKAVFDSLKNAFIEFGLDGCECRFIELVNAGKAGKLSVIGEKDIQPEYIRLIVPSSRPAMPDYEEDI